MVPVTGIEAATQAMFNSEGFRKSLIAMERSVVQNIYHEQQLKYRGIRVRATQNVLTF